MELPPKLLDLLRSGKTKRFIPWLEEATQKIQKVDWGILLHLEGARIEFREGNEKGNPYTRFDIQLRNEKGRWTSPFRIFPDVHTHLHHELRELQRRKPPKVVKLRGKPIEKLFQALAAKTSYCFTLSTQKKGLNPLYIKVDLTTTEVNVRLERIYIWSKELACENPKQLLMEAVVIAYRLWEKLDEVEISVGDSEQEFALLSFEGRI